MRTQLKISIGEHSSAGRKARNQDFHAAMLAREPLLSSKGIAAAIADGISTSDVSHIASQTSVKGFVEDYYATPETWSVKTAAQRVMQASNSWLYAQSRSGPNRFDLNRGYVCTFSAVVLKSATAHLFHIGDSRIYALSGERLELLTEDHRVWHAEDKSYLSRALGMRERLDIDYLTRELAVGDTFLLTTDGVHEHMDASFVLEMLDLHAADLDAAAKRIVQHAYARGSEDNLTLQILRVDELPPQDIDELHRQAVNLPFPPELRARMQFDGYEILRELHHSSRSHVYLARDLESGQQVALKTPSVDLRDDAAYLERFLMEEWIARRVDSPHILKACAQTRPRGALYLAMEYVEGQTLAQWMRDNPQPDLERVRDILEQIARGLRALHRLEMLHQDLRPNNIMLDSNGTVILIDFGSVRVAGIAELGDVLEQQHLLGTAQYTAPEYFLGEAGTPQSDQFSLGVIAYQMLSGALPYGTAVARTTTRAAQHKLSYQPMRSEHGGIPTWVDEAVRRAVQPSPHKRYDDISEFIYDLRHPNPQYLRQSRPPLLERNPVAFWQGLCALLLLIVIALAGTHPGIVSGSQADQTPPHPLARTGAEQ